jgi:hypothetical protein
MSNIDDIKAARRAKLEGNVSDKSGRHGSKVEKLEENVSDKTARRGSNVDKLEDWLDQTEERLYKAAVETGRRRSSLMKVSEFSNFMKDIQDDYVAQGFSEKSAEKEMTEIKCRKPLPGSKKGTLKEKNDLIVNFITSVEKKTEDIGLAWEHYGSANPAYSVIPSYRNEDKSLPTFTDKNGGCPADKYSKEGMDTGMDAFETQFSGLIRGTEAAAAKMLGRK